MTELRTLTPQDWRLWRGLRLAALADAPHAFGSRLADWQGTGDREERWRDRLALSGTHLAAVRDGVPCGMASGVRGEHPGTTELISMWVARDARGHGVGDLLIRAVETWAAGTGAALLTLAVADGNEPAAALYRRNGFAFTADPLGRMPDGRPERLMAKRLPAAPV
ncbi:GNAT family N-acetyltransferase [Streptomyces sp. NPDC046977]|uniref:GNAT family N-acetyltransferase n=1 Tax=Streptomyces sp. NPDC046977 TaxID=3154703 RepID=UPI0033CAC637